MPEAVLGTQDGNGHTPYRDELEGDGKTPFVYYRSPDIEPSSEQR